MLEINKNTHTQKTKNKKKNKKKNNKNNYTPLLQILPESTYQRQKWNNKQQCSTCVDKAQHTNQGCVQKHKVIANVLPWIPVSDDERQQE